MNEREREEERNRKKITQDRFTTKNTMQDLDLYKTLQSTYYNF